MTEADWLTGTDVTAFVRFAADHLSPRRQRLLATGFCRVVSHLFNHPELNEKLGVIERYADGVVSAAEVEKARQRCRGIAQASFDEYRIAVDSRMGDSRRAYARQEFAWAVAYTPVDPLPLSDVAARAAFAAQYASTETDAVELPGTLVTYKSPTGELANTMRSVVWEVIGNPFRAVHFKPDWRTDTAKSLARQMYESREFSAMPILADALQDAGCDNEDVLTHCRDTTAKHIRGCWVLDLVLGKE